MEVEEVTVGLGGFINSQAERKKLFLFDGEINKKAWYRPRKKQADEAWAAEISESHLKKSVRDDFVWAFGRKREEDIKITNRARGPDACRGVN